MAPAKLRVAVIGAGASGLCAARHLLASPASFAPPVVFEASAHLGGTWVYTEESGQEGRPVHSSMYQDLRTNLPKEVMAFPDFPFEPSLPSFPHHSAVLAYLQRYAETFHVRDHIRFQWQVDDVQPLAEGEGSPGGWAVRASWQGPLGGGRAATVTEECFDAVMVCTGHYSVPFVPPVPGLDSFPGRLLHSHSFRRRDPFVGLSEVVLVGRGPSGVDLALLLSDAVTGRLLLSHRGAPVRGLPRNVAQVPPIARVDGPRVVFGDGSEAQPDALILCTGYRAHFPFLPLERLGLREAEHGLAPLYRHLVPPGHPTLFLLGLCQLICPFPHFHYQALFALAVLAGRCPLPPAAKMGGRSPGRAGGLPGGGRGAQALPPDAGAAVGLRRGAGPSGGVAHAAAVRPGDLGRVARAPGARREPLPGQELPPAGPQRLGAGGGLQARWTGGVTQKWATCPPACPSVVSA